MRNFLAWGLLAALALPARADIVDGGNLQIGGQGLFGGTVTVQGNALGVAGSVSATSATLSGTGAQTYALTTSSGIHMVNGKLKLDSGAMVEWPDGTRSTTAAGGGGGAGDALLNATQTFSGANTFLNVAALTYGPAAGPKPINVMQESVWAKSVDGASQSSGCVVVIKVDSNSADANIIFTSTTSVPTRANSGPYGVLLETCSPGSICRVGTRGFYRVQAGPSAIGAGYTDMLSSTRCTTHPNGNDDLWTVGWSISQLAVAASEWHWIFLRN